MEPERVGEESRIIGNLSWLLLRLAGRVDDAALAVMRASAGDEDPAAAAEILQIALLERPALTADEARIVEEVLRWSGGQPVDPAPGQVAELPRTEHRFLPPPGGEPAPELLAAVVSAGQDVGGIRAAWRAHRESAGETAGVWFVETEPLADVIELTAEIQHRLVLAGETPPRVEVFAEDEAVTPYHEAGLAVAALVWVRDDLPAPRVARTSPGQTRLEGHDRDRVLAYLTAGDEILRGYGLALDVLAERPGATVRLGFQSDGTWIWAREVVHRLERYHLAPDPQLVAHVLARRGPPPRVGRLARHRAMTALVGGGRPRRGAEVHRQVP